MKRILFDPKTRIPVDLKRCQAEKKLGAFQMGGDPSKRTRCNNIPSFIATKRLSEWTDSVKGAMSLCGECKKVCESWLADEVTFAEIKAPLMQLLQHSSECPTCGTRLRARRQGGFVCTMGHVWLQGLADAPTKKEPNGAWCYKCRHVHARPERCGVITRNHVVCTCAGSKKMRVKGRV